MDLLRRGDEGGQVKYLQQLLGIGDDRIFGGGTERAVRTFQKENEIRIDGIVGAQTWEELQALHPDKPYIPDPRELTEQDLIDAAEYLGVELACVKAVNDVESRGSGFVGDGMATILCEGHWFYKRLKANGLNPNDYMYDKNGNRINQDILYKSWTSEYYIGGAGEYSRFNHMYDIDPASAIESTSWGLFQVMGFNWLDFGDNYKDATDFYNRMNTSEREQLLAFIYYIEANGLTDELNRHDWASFAEQYNGSGYAKNHYDVKLERAYIKYK